MTLRAASIEDLTQIEQIVRASGLPVEDCRDHLSNFFVAVEDTRVIGVGGLQVCGSTGLVRSLAVVPEHRRKGIGARIYRQIETRASQLGIGELYLLTVSAHGYFENLGFTRRARGEVPAPVAVTKQFVTLCPESAVLMFKNNGRPR